MATIESVAYSLENFRAACGRYPNTQEGLEALIDRPPGLKCKYPEKGFLPNHLRTSHGIKKTGP
ncbi:MAG: type II secretion system protein GspG [Oligoflexia bacterium]|nr:type II secretion system protein GspG [Oligoflexia bacterium]